MKFLYKKAFTLVELLVVIAIIALLASVVVTSLSIVRAKGRDARKQSDTAAVKTALTLYQAKNDEMPPNYLCDGEFCSGGGGNEIAFEDVDSPDDPQTESGMAYRESMLDLVEGGFLSTVPESPNEDPYGYIDYGPGAGAFFVTTLEAPPGGVTPDASRPYPPFGPCEYSGGDAGFLFPDPQGCMPYFQGYSEDAEHGVCEYLQYAEVLTGQQYLWCKDYVHGVLSYEHYVEVFGNGESWAEGSVYYRPCAAPGDNKWCGPALY